MRLSTTSLIAVILSAGCQFGGHDGDEGEGETGGSIDSGTTDSDTTDSGETDTVDRLAGTINGTVSVQLYVEAADELTEEVSWADAYGDQYPFGAIFVAAYTVDETTNLTTYHAEYVISAPSTTGDAYSLQIDPDDTETVYVYAALDWWPDGVLGTNEPVGLHGDLVAVIEGGETNDVDIVINAPLLPEGGGSGGGDGTGGGGDGSGGPYITLDGDVTIDQAYSGGDGKVLLYDTSGNGPTYMKSFTPTATEDGAVASFSLSVAANLGEQRLLGAWDENQNGLLEPTDVWGAYVVAGENANPITVGSVSTSGYTVLLPYGLPPTLNPFVRLEGSVSYPEGFASLPAGAVMYVAAMRTRPSLDFGVADFGRGYDWQSFVCADLPGTATDYLLVTPSNAVAYIWAYLDLDGDGILNEPGEPSGSVGRSGRVATGSVNATGLDMVFSDIVVE
ncbi:MAG: hypothetical protein Q8P18_30330 [Pseudomonadota bacterium]|nr:hypothetical protein [Pseudomonadota bacterium]